LLELNGLHSDVFCIGEQLRDLAGDLLSAFGASALQPGWAAAAVLISGDSGAAADLRL